MHEKTSKGDFTTQDSGKKTENWTRWEAEAIKVVCPLWMKILSLQSKVT